MENRVQSEVSDHQQLDLEAKDCPLCVGGWIRAGVLLLFVSLNFLFFRKEDTSCMVRSQMLPCLFPWMARQTFKPGTSDVRTASMLPVLER